jgi:hypothetical protein
MCAIASQGKRVTGKRKGTKRRKDEKDAHIKSGPH